MKTINTFTFILFLMLTGSLFSCKEELDIEIPDSASRVVVEAEVTTETDSSFVKLTRSVNYYSNATIPGITNAVVQVNGIPYIHVADGIYKPASPYTGVAGQSYTLNIQVDGKTYTANSLLEPMFLVDSIFQTFKPKSGFLDEGYSISYTGLDLRPKIKYTYFRLGFYDVFRQKDSLDDFKVLFDNTQTPVGVPYIFELPFTRFKVGEECVMIFRSIDKAMNDFLLAYNQQSSGAPGPFKVPPADLPTNIRGGAVGYFATYDVVRRRYTVK